MPSICQGNWDCQNCPKAVGNAIAHIIYQRGFHRPAHKCEENFILFWWRERCWLIVRNMQVRCSEKVSLFFRLSDQNLRCLLWLNANVFIIVSFNRSCFAICVLIISWKRYLLRLSIPFKNNSWITIFLEWLYNLFEGDKVCRELLSLKRKELAFVLGYYYSDYDLASLVHPLSKYTNGFQCFVIQNYKK